jgi:hypothetical protein
MPPGSGPVNVFCYPLSIRPSNQARKNNLSISSTALWIVCSPFGKDTGSSTVNPAAMNIALTADAMNAEGQKVLAAVAESLALKYPAPRKK